MIRYKLTPPQKIELNVGSVFEHVQWNWINAKSPIHNNFQKNDKRSLWKIWCEIISYLIFTLDSDFIIFCFQLFKKIGFSNPTFFRFATHFFSGLIHTSPIKNQVPNLKKNWCRFKNKCPALFSKLRYFSLTGGSAAVGDCCNPIFYQS